MAFPYCFPVGIEGKKATPKKGPESVGTGFLSSQGRPEIEELHKFKPKCLPAPQEEVQLVDHYVDSRGQKRVKGNRALKKSQAYTIQSHAVQKKALGWTHKRFP